MLKTAPVCHTWPIFALFWQLTFRRRSFARNVEVLLVFFRKLHCYINQNLSYYCHFLHWQRPFKILLCVVSVNESCIDLRHRFIVFKAGCSSSTRIRIRRVFKKFHSRERFQTFSVLEFAFSSDTCGWNVYQQKIFADTNESGYVCKGPKLHKTYNNGLI